MSNRKVHEIGNVCVYYNSDFQEYIVKRKGSSDGYFTSDKQDAIDTADTMAHEKNPAGEHKFGVFLWRGDGRYKVSDALKTYVREGSAQRHADTLNETYVGEGGYVVRTLQYLQQ